jgi:UTP--glucose-1-phosphate uridylyltransferase
MKSTIRKAIIPVAGLGTRFLPATKAQPKEMLTIVDKPIIQYVVEDAVAAGIEEIIFVTSQSKRAIEDHFDRNAELEQRLTQKNKKAELKMLEDISSMAKFAFVRQHVPLGDGHALLAALPFVDPNESVIVLFGDNVYDVPVPISKQLMDVHERYNDPVIALYEVGKENAPRYGIADGKRISPKIMELHGFVEKPSVKDAPSGLAAIGAYVITPEIGRILRTLKPKKGGELRLADAFERHIKNGSAIYGMTIDGRWYDCGNKTDFMIASVDFALKHPEANADRAFTKYLKKKLQTLT